MTPLIDLHRHLGGSITPEVVWSIIQKQKQLSSLADSLKAVEQDLTYKHDDKQNLTFHKFLQKFGILNYIRWDEDTIDYAINNVIADMKTEGLEYCELRFSINKYLNYIPWDERASCLFVLNRIEYWSKEHGVKIGPILCIKHESPKIESERISKLIHHWRIAEQVAGIDVVGAESHFSKRYIKDSFRYWEMCGKGRLIHAGETQSAENVKIAINDLKVTRIAHGIAAANDKDVLQLAVDKGVVFDIALTSNYLTGVTKITDNHPVIKMIKAGCIITIGTDDPAIFHITIQDEYDLLKDILTKAKMSNIDNIIENIKRNSVNYALQYK